MAVPGPRLVIVSPSTTTRLSASVWSGSLLTKAGCAVARFPSSIPWLARTTAGDAQMAAVTAFSRRCWRLRSSVSAPLSRRRSAPGIPPGRTIASKSSSAHSVTSLSATRTTPREQVTCRDSSTDATVTCAPARRSTSIGTTASISSDPLATATSTDLAGFALILFKEQPGRFDGHGPTKMWGCERRTLEQPE